ncbi:MAG: rhombosortase [Gammaproteobacteria bacterium]
MTSSTPRTARSGPRERLGVYAAAAVIGVLSLLLEMGGEPLRLAARYERAGLAEGELWRLFSAHLVHLGPSHMLMNVLALAVLAYVLAPRLTALDWVGTAIVAALTIDAGLYWLSPAVAWYVGLSGVLHGFWASGCVYAWLRLQPEALPLTALIVVKLAWESLAGPVPLTGAIAGGPVVAAAHLYGAVGGVLWSLSASAVRRRLGLPL